MSNFLFVVDRSGGVVTVTKVFQDGRRIPFIHSCETVEVGGKYMVTLRFMCDEKPEVEFKNSGCRKRLAEGQWWSFCGETDMGQTLPALCTECGGEFKLAEDQGGRDDK